MRFVRLVLAVLFAGGGVVTIGCGSGASVPFAPAAPTVSGATIQGTVQGGGLSSHLSAPVVLSAAAGLRVSVVGTSLSATTDAAGGFVLSGVPAGRVELRFEGPGVDARLEIAGLAAGQTMTITVRVSGAQAELVPSGKVEIRGQVHRVDPPNLVVAGRRVATDAQTRILGRQNEPIPLSALRPGDDVEVEGSVQADNSILAEKIKLEDEDDEEDEVEFTGQIESLNPFRVAGRPVLVDGGTRILDDDNDSIPFSALRVGDRVEVEGQLQPGGAVRAKKIKIED